MAQAQGKEKSWRDASQDLVSGSEQEEAGSTAGSESYSDSNTDPAILECSDSEGEYLRERIQYHKAQGRAKSKRSDWSNSLVSREFQHWEDFCRKVKSNPTETLRLCEAETFKTYLEWRVKSFRIKKESTIKMYWRRMLCKYIDVAGHSMDNGAELDIQDWIPTVLTRKYNLDTSEKEKHAMHVQDLFVILHAHWTQDWKPSHGRFRVEMSLMLLLSGATATRPGALVESPSARHSNKVLCYEHISIMKVRNAKDPGRTTTVALVDLVHVKNSGGKGRRKRFIFRLESIPAFCIVSHILALAIADDAFRNRYASAEDIFNLKIGQNKQCLKVKFKKDILNRPIFRDVERKHGDMEVSEQKALPHSKCRDHFVWLGRLAGFEQSLELYQLRRGSGRKLNSALTPEERNQTMGHHGSTYEQFYMPDLIERDFMSIYFGTPAQDDLIQRVARMGISRDDRAPTELTEEQKLEIKNDSQLVELRETRERYRRRINDRGYRTMEAASGTRTHTKYEQVNRMIKSRTEALKRGRLQQAILDFHDEIDAQDIERQRNGDSVPDKYTQPVVQHEFHERAVISKMLSEPLTQFNETRATKLRVTFIHNLTMYCFRQERQRHEATSMAIPTRTKSEDAKSELPPERGLSYHGRSPDRKPPSSPGLKCALPSAVEGKADDGPDMVRIKDEDMELAPQPYPMKLTGHVCLICIGKEGFSMTGRIRPFAKKYTLQKHLDGHVAEGLFNQKFQCKHPCCVEWIDGLEHFMNHAALAHGVWHAVKRWT